VPGWRGGGLSGHPLLARFCPYSGQSVLPRFARLPVLQAVRPSVLCTFACTAGCSSFRASPELLVSQVVFFLCGFYLYCRPFGLPRFIRLPYGRS